jgi:hypothetical protein
MLGSGCPPVSAPHTSDTRGNASATPSRMYVCDSAGRAGGSTSCKRVGGGSGAGANDKGGTGVRRATAGL